MRMMVPHERKSELLVDAEEYKNLRFDAEDYENYGYTRKNVKIDSSRLRITVRRGIK